MHFSHLKLLEGPPTLQRSSTGRLLISALSFSCPEPAWFLPPQTPALTHREDAAFSFQLCPLPRGLLCQRGPLIGRRSRKEPSLRTEPRRETSLTAISHTEIYTLHGLWPVKEKAGQATNHSVPQAHQRAEVRAQPSVLDSNETWAPPGQMRPRLGSPESGHCRERCCGHCTCKQENSQRLNALPDWQPGAPGSRRHILQSSLPWPPPGPGEHALGCAFPQDGFSN